MINTFIQILLSVFLIAIMAFICYSIYNKELVTGIDLSTSNKKITKVFSGIIDYVNNKNIEIETYNKKDFTYLDINPSINQNGGSEYSYNFWLYFDIDTTSQVIYKNYALQVDNPPTDEQNKITGYSDSKTGKDYTKYKYLTLFYKGEKPIKKLFLKRNYEYNYDCSDKTLDMEIPVIIKNPLVKLRNDGKKLIIDYNNINFPTTYNNSANRLVCANDDFLDKTEDNKFGLQQIDVEKYKKKFNMITIVFKEQSHTEELFYKQNANCKIYFNNKLISDRLANVNNIDEDTISNVFKSRVMKSNFSKLYINPDNLGDNITTYNNIRQADGITESSPLQMADLTYFNYALDQTEITRLYNNGFNKYPAVLKKRIEKNFLKGDYIRGSDIDQI